MKIAFLIPNYSGHVVGSLLVYYRYAVILAQAGHEVDLFHPVIVEDDPSFPTRVRAVVWALAKKWSSKPIPWFEFPPRVKLHFRPSLEGMVLPHDIVVAFSWRMVEALASIRAAGKRFGYIVEYETWAEAQPQRKLRMEAAYRRELPLLCSSTAVEGMLREVGACDIRLCVHGVEVDRFAKAKEGIAREAGRIGFPVRMEAVKSPEVLREAVGLLRTRYGNTVLLWGYGHSSTPPDMAELFDEFHPSPSDAALAELYARSAIFAIPSRKEGFGMPAAEAMSAGCAVASTDNGGIRTFGIDGLNCLLVPPDSPSALAEAVGRLLDDTELRRTISERAPDSVSFLRWEFAGSRLLEQLGAVRP